MNISSWHSAAGDDGRPTREKILQGACGLFAHQGFQNTTVQQICRQAGANIASVNYYFGGKGKLYAAAWAYAVKLADQVDGPLDDELPPEEWLRLMLQQRIQVIFSDGPSGWLPRLIEQEIHHRTIHFPAIRQTFLRPIRARFDKQVSRYLGPKATPFQVESAVSAIMGFLPMMIQLRENRKTPIRPDEMKQLASQTQAYVLGGMAAIKRLLDKETT